SAESLLAPRTRNEAQRVQQPRAKRRAPEFGTRTQTDEQAPLRTGRSEERRVGQQRRQAIPKTREERNSEHRKYRYRARGPITDVWPATLTLLGSNVFRSIFSPRPLGPLSSTLESACGGLLGVARRGAPNARAFRVPRAKGRAPEFGTRTQTDEQAPLRTG